MLGEAGDRTRYPERAMVDFVEVYVARDLAHAYLMKGVLEEAGISVEIGNEFLQGAQFSIAPTLLVAEADARRAHELLRAFDESATEGRAPSETRRVGVVTAGLIALLVVFALGWFCLLVI